MQKHKQDETELSPKVPLNGNTLRQTLRAFQEHHRACYNRRQLGRVHEISVEEQRRQLLSKKYQDNLRQVNGGRPESGRPQLNSTSDCTETMDTKSQVTDHVQTSAQPTPVQESTAVPVPEPVSGGAVSRKQNMSSSANPDVNMSSVVKLEPQSPEHIKRGNSPPVINKTSPAASISSKSSLSPPPTSKTPPYSSDPPDPKRRKVQSRKSSEALRPPPPRKSSFGSNDDCSDDLTLSAEDCHSITNSTARLLRPLEEAESSSTTAAVSLSPTSSNGTAGGKQGSSGLTGAGGPAGPHNTTEDVSFLQHELDEFSKVMAQVSQEEAAKERQGSSFPMMQFDLHNTPYLGSLGNTAPPNSLYNSSQSYSRTSGSSSLHHSSNGQPNFALMTRQSSGGIGDSAYHFCGGAHTHQAQGQLDAGYSQTLPPLQGSQHLHSPMAHSSQTSLVSVCTNNSSPFSDHMQNISLSNEHYRRISTLSSPMDHFSPHQLPSSHPSYGQSSAGFGYVGSSGMPPDWSQHTAQDPMLTRVGTHPESVAFMGGKMPPSAGRNSNMQAQMARQYQTSYTGPSNQPFPHTISYGRFTNSM